MKKNQISRQNIFWPRHARGRTLLTLDCGHFIYEDLENNPDNICPFCAATEQAQLKEQDLLPPKSSISTDATEKKNTIDDVTEK